MKTTPLVAVLLACACLPAFAGDEVAPPPSSDAAPAALAASPRHGEWVDVPLEGNEHPIKSWIVYPERPDKAPVVIVIHEIFGMTDWVRGVTDALAAEGFIAIAPDMLSGLGPDGGGTESFSDDVRGAIQRLTPDDRVQRLDAVLAFAQTLPAATDRVGCVGFCWGGTTSFLYASRQPALGAAVVYYGSASDNKEELAAIACPVLGLYGGDDARVTSTVESTTQHMKELDKPYTTHVYTGAGHGFLRQQDGRDGANLEASKRAWTATLAFFREQLETKSD